VLNSLIIHEERAKQLINFGGILTPPLCLTDMDACFEFHDKGYLFVEVKYKGKKVPEGQRIFLERITKRLAISVKAVTIVVDHEIEDPKETINLCDCKVRKVFWGDIEQWALPKKPCTAGEFINTYHKWLEKL
jgi:hypothetical protein